MVAIAIKPQAQLLIGGTVCGLQKSGYPEVFSYSPTPWLCLHINAWLFAYPYNLSLEEEDRSPRPNRQSFPCTHRERGVEI